MSKAKITETIQHIVDNLTLVMRMLKHNSDFLHTPLTMIISNMVVQIQIEQELEALFTIHHTTVETFHTKAYQDRIPGPLTWEAALNTEAELIDEEASLREKAAEMHLPWCHALIWSDGRQLTSNITKQIETRWSCNRNPNPIGYLLKKYGV